MRWLAQYATRVAVRRVVTILVLALLAWVGIGRAEAHTVGQCTAQEPCDRATAYSLASDLDVATAHCVAWTGNAGAYADPANFDTRLNTTSTAYYSYGRCLNASGGAITGAQAMDTFHFSGCPAGSEWNESTKTCFNEAECNAKPPITGVRSPGMSGTVCSGGCQFEPDGVGLTAAFGGGDPMTVAPKGWKPTGQACQAGDPAPEPMPQEGACTPLGANQTACMQEDGKHCHVTPSGKRFCWQPGEVGEKTDGPDLQRTDPGETPQTPNPPESGDQLIPEGQPVTTEITQNGRKTTTTTTSYSTQHGTNAGTGPGQAEGGGTGSGGGNGDGDGDGDDDAGGVGDGVGDLYEASGKTVEGVVGDFVERMGNAGIIAAAGNFMGNCSFAGNCPVWTWDGGDYAGTMTFDQLCSGALSSLLQYGGWIVLALGAFAAFRIAVY